MGRTVPSYRIATEIERNKWKIFRQRLDKSERKIFDEMMSYSRLYNTAGVSACKPILIQPILMSIIFEHYKQLKKLELTDAMREDDIKQRKTLLIRCLRIPLYRSI